MTQKLSNTVLHIQRLSRVIKWLCLVGLALTLAGIIAGGLIFDISSTKLSTIETGPYGQDLALRLAHLPRQLATCLTFATAARLFHQYACGEIFTKRSTQWFGYFAFAMLAAACLTILQGAFAAVIEMLIIDSNKLSIHMELEGDDIAAVVFSLMLIAISWIQQEAYKQSDEIRLIF